MKMLTVVTSPRFADHVTPPGHPERPERAEAMDVVAARWKAAGGAILEPAPAGDDDLLRVHTPAHLDAIAGLAGRAAMIDEDTFTSPESETVARLGAGAAIAAVRQVLEGPAGSRALALVRPPGHHAEPDQAMGFCLYNNVAVAAAWARSHGVARVAIVDYDVHHGNGTAAAFAGDADVLFVSAHQFPFYPGAGAVDEAGTGEGRGFTVNVPLEAGATDADYDLVFRDVVVPVVRAFEPGVLVVSAGFDAHERDPLAGMRMTSEGYARITARLLAVADEVCEGRVAFVTEGGYDTSALVACLDAVIAAAASQGGNRSEAPAGGTARGEAAVHEVRRVHAAAWPVLARRPGPI